MVELSSNDLKRGVTLPVKECEELAEFFGILAGDGYVGCSKKKNYEVGIAGHLKEDLEFLVYVKEIISKLFNLEPKINKREKINTAYLYLRSRGIFTYLISSGFKKENCLIDVPSWVWKKHTSYFVRGLFDTDGSVTLKSNHGIKEFYPVIKICLKDKKLIKKLSNWINSKEINHCVGEDSRLDSRTNKVYTKYYLQISGYKNVGKWVKIVGSSNPKHKNKMGRAGLST